MKKEHIKEILGLLSIPIILLIIYLIFFVLWKLLGLPSPEELVDIVTSFFNTYGLIVIFLSALVEGVLLLGQYFPGGFVIFLGVISAGKNIPLVIKVVSLVSLAFFISYYINYLLGRHGFYKAFAKLGFKKSIEKAEKKLKKHALNAIIFSYWEPNLASITATAAGVLRLDVKKFLIYSAIGIIIWNTFWGILVYLLGKSALKLASSITYVLIVFVIWVAIIITKYYLWNQKSSNLSKNSLR